MGKVLMSGIVPTLKKPGVQYIITFHNNDGTSDKSSLETNKEGKLLELPIAIRGGYSFKGWFTAPSGGTQITTSTIFTQDTVVYAQWEVAMCTINISGSGNTYAYVKLPDGTKVTSAGTYTVAPGSTIVFSITGYSSSRYGTLTIDGTTVATATNKTGKTYNWTIPSGVNSASVTITANKTYGYYSIAVVTG